jgi:hypothetical protein
MPDGDTITQANGKLVATVDQTFAGDDDFYFCQDDWSALDPVGGGQQEAAYDGCLAADLDGLWRNSSGLSINTQYTSANLDTTRISKTGATYYGLIGYRDKNNIAPATDELYSLGIAMANHGTAGYRPVLTVLHEAGGGGTVIPVFLNQYRQRWSA